MKQIVYTLAIAAAFAACSPTAQSVKEDCLKNTDFATIYGEQLEAYCSCVEQKLLETEKTMPLQDSIVQNVTQSCAVEFTTLDTDF
ncbi:MAG: hypothetical protein LBR55_05890 [Bacteroidales bacterium]|jgi:hypothetical protein|nr:hypothetical protein [Bacteroidales bacterium]